MSRTTVATPPVHLSAATAASGPESIRKFLLGCGILSSMLYIGAEMYAWTRYPGYSPISQVFSELLAEGAPTRPFMVAVSTVPYNVLVAAFGIGVWISAGGRRV